MKYTKEQLQGMSDLEVNRALAMVMHKYAGVVGDWMPNGVKVNDDSGFFYSECDYCNNWNDVMHLAVEHGVTYIKSMNKAVYDMRVDCYELVYDVEFDSDKPQRSIACCLILVLQER